MKWFFRNRDGGRYIQYFISPKIRMIPARVAMLDSQTLLSYRGA